MAGPPAAWQLQLLEQQGAELLGRVDGELVPDRVVRLALDARHLAREFLTERLQVGQIDGDPGFLHLDQDVDERKLDLGEELAHPEAVEIRVEERAELRRGDRSRARAREPLLGRRDPVRILAVRHGKDGDLELQPLRGEILQRVITAARVHEVGREHRVHRHAAQLGTGTSERAARGLRVVRDLGDGVIREERRDRRGDAGRRRDVPRLVARRQAEARGASGGARRRHPRAPRPPPPRGASPQRSRRPRH